MHEKIKNAIIGEHSMDYHLLTLVKMYQWNRFLTPNYLLLFNKVSELEHQNLNLTASTVIELAKIAMISEETIFNRLRKMTRLGMVKFDGTKLEERQWSFLSEGREFYELYLKHAPNHYAKLSIREMILLLELPEEKNFQVKQLLTPTLGWRKYFLRQSLHILTKYLLVEKKGLKYKERLYRLTEEGQAVKIFFTDLYKYWEATFIATKVKLHISPVYYNWITTQGLQQLAILTTLTKRPAQLGKTSELGPMIGLEPTKINEYFWELDLNKLVEAQQKSRDNVTIRVTSTGASITESIENIVKPKIRG